jgi:hypothetical protein
MDRLEDEIELREQPLPDEATCYAPTLDQREMTPAERATAAASSVDDVALEL